MSHRADDRTTLQSGDLVSVHLVGAAGREGFFTGEVKTFGGGPPVVVIEGADVPDGGELVQLRARLVEASGIHPDVCDDDHLVKALGEWRRRDGGQERIRLAESNDQLQADLREARAEIERCHERVRELVIARDDELGREAPQPGAIHLHPATPGADEASATPAPGS